MPAVIELGGRAPDEDIFSAGARDGLDNAKPAIESNGQSDCDFAAGRCGDGIGVS